MQFNRHVNEVINVRNEVAKVMFLHLSVCPQGGGEVSGPGGACSGMGCLLPWVGAWSRGLPDLGGGVWAKWGYLLGGGGASALRVTGLGGGGVCWGPGPRRVCSGGGFPACTEVDTPQQMATVADGTHPTGMHSCFKMATEEDQFAVHIKQWQGLKKIFAFMFAFAWCE